MSPPTRRERVWRMDTWIKDYRRPTSHIVQGHRIQEWGKEYKHVQLYTYDTIMLSRIQQWRPEYRYRILQLKKTLQCLFLINGFLSITFRFQNTQRFSFVTFVLWRRCWLFRLQDQHYLPRSPFLALWLSPDSKLLQYYF